MFKRPPVLMHQRSKWVTLYLRKEKTIFSAKFLPPMHCLLPNSRRWGRTVMWMGGRRRHQQHSPRWQQPSLFLRALGIPLLHRRRWRWRDALLSGMRCSPEGSAHEQPLQHPQVYISATSMFCCCHESPVWHRKRTSIVSKSYLTWWVAT